MNTFRAKRQADGRIDLLPPEPKAPARKRAHPFPARLEVVDADFVVIRGGGARTSNDNHRPVRPATAGPRPQNRLFRIAAAGAQLGEAGLQLLSGRAFAGLVAATCLFVFAYAGGLSALRAALPPAGPADPLRVADVTAMIGDRNGMKVLSVYGRVDNAGAGAEVVPPLEIRVEGAERTLQRRVALDATTIAPGGSEHFALHIPHGGGKVPKVSVSFVGEGAPAN
ncbi:hypothetical protein [Shinella sp. BYT-45]|uniref:hypothetical protein n=1 Tax=Shinella sp. BYT-45 TaxID=3377377 RepID=UPI00397EA4AE